MEKTIVNIGDRIWYRESGIDSRVTYGTVVRVKDYGIVTLQCDAWQETVNLCAIKYYNVNNDGGTTPVFKYVWSKITA